MKQCEKGHIFDEARHSSCPYCKEDGNTGVRPLESNSDFSAPAFPKTMPLGATPEAPEQKKPAKEIGVTVALNVSENGINPARGWIVATNGDKAGLSFVLHSERNYIGRGTQFDVNMSFDRSASKEGDATITFDARAQKFYLAISAGKNNIYYNGSILLQPVELKDYDIVEIGETKFVFRSLCNEQFTY